MTSYSIGTLPQIVEGYANGYFPMANHNGRLSWYSSQTHTLMPLDERFHVPRSLKRALNSGRFEVRINTAFAEVVQGCAAREETWISDELEGIYLALNRAGVAHSFETWEGDVLAGGVLGLALGGAFIGESMFFRIPEGSKVALVRLVEHLRARGFTVFDAQLQNPHLERFGSFEMREKEYKGVLERAIQLSIRFI
jgi:leucyl/phenylalanyl-tRNA---protein transferase